MFRVGVQFWYGRDNLHRMGMFGFTAACAEKRTQIENVLVTLVTHSSHGETCGDAHTHKRKSSQDRISIQESDSA